MGTSGKKMTPLFQDGARPQLIVELMQTGFPISMGEGRYNVSQYTRLIERGQDEAAVFAQTGRSPRPGEALSLCPVGAHRHAQCLCIVHVYVCMCACAAVRAV